MAKRFGELRVIHDRIVDVRSDLRRRNVALTPVRHALHVHDLLMITAVVPHDREHRDLVMRRGPQRAGSIHRVAVVLDVDADTPAISRLVSE